MAVIQWFSQTILSSQTIHYSLHFLSLPSPTPSNLPLIPPFIPLIFFFSTINWQNSSIVIPTKSFVFMFWIVLFVFLNHLNIPHTPNPLFHPISFFYSLTHSLISFSTIPSIPFTFLLLLLLLTTLTTSLYLEWCATPFILLFRQRNANNHTSFLNSKYDTDSSFFFTLLLIHWRITSWNKQSFPAFVNLYTSS